MAARLKTTCKPRTAPAYGRAVKKKQRVNLEPRRPMAARLKKKQRVNLEDLLDLITALLKFKSSLSTTVAAQCRFQSSP